MEIANKKERKRHNKSSPTHCTGVQAYRYCKIHDINIANIIHGQYS